MYLPQYETSLGHITRLMFLKQYHNFLVVRLYSEDEGKADLRLREKLGLDGNYYSVK